ncbi:MAG TPA: OsmC family protein [Puia sp.]|nr:OsmC family protein [Puia sp.]
MEKEHLYTLSVIWTGNKGEGTSGYKAYGRDHIIQSGSKAEIAGSADPNFRGSPERYNPEELFVSSISTCHMLWYLHFCSVNRIVVTDYRDQARGIMVENPDGSGYFKEVELNPVITLTQADMVARAEALHHEAHKFCFIANSCNFPITHKPVFKIQPA